ncbi:MAG: carboxypeptidase-like regulatory domain-containing protein [Sandaracinaceae bacterium]
MLRHRLAVHVPLLGWLLAGALALGGCDNGPITEGYELSGRVSEFVGPDEQGMGIEGAHVTFRSDTLIVADTTTDSGGRYRMRIDSDFPFGQVRAEAGGYRTEELTVFFDQPIRRIDLELRPGGM